MVKNFNEQEFVTEVTEKIGGYRFKNPKLLKQAFVRKSYTAEHGGENNEVMEFIGDKALDVAVVRYLTQHYGSIDFEELDRRKADQARVFYDIDEQEAFFNGGRRKECFEFSCSLDEGGLTRLKQRMVEKRTLAKRMEELGLAKYLIVGKGDEEKNIKDEQSVKEDLFEAIIGAVALDSSWDFAQIVKVVEVMLRPETLLYDGEVDFVGAIYEWASKKKSMPQFRFEDYNCGLRYHEPNVICSKTSGEVTCRLFISDDIPLFEGYGRSRNAARRDACIEACRYLDKKNMFFSITDEIENPNPDDAIGQLETIARRGYFSVPQYEENVSYDDNGNPIWTMTCIIPEKKKTFSAKNSVKKIAKKQAAFKMLKHILKLR